MANENTIRVQTDQPGMNVVISGTPLPGMLAEMTTTKGTFKAHATAGGIAERILFCEDSFQGKEISDAYVTGSQGRATAFLPGDICMARIANGQAVTVGAKLVSNGDGYFKVAVADSSGVVIEDTVMGIALEAKDLSDSSGADPAYQLVQMRVI